MFTFNGTLKIEIENRGCPIRHTYNQSYGMNSILITSKATKRKSLNVQSISLSLSHLYKRNYRPNTVKKRKKTKNNILHKIETIRMKRRLNIKIYILAKYQRTAKHIQICRNEYFNLNASNVQRSPLLFFSLALFFLLVFFMCFFPSSPFSLSLLSRCLFNQQ